MTTSQSVMRGLPKDLKTFLKTIEGEGWSWYLRRSGHIRLDGPNGEVVFTGGTPADKRTIKNIRQDMRRETTRKRHGRD